MALGTMTKVAGGPGSGDALRLDYVSFAGDGAYPSGGTVDFEGTVQALFGDAREVLAVVDVGLNGGYVTRYDKANDKLLVLEGNYDGSDGPLQESSTANLSGVTFKLLIISK